MVNRSVPRDSTRNFSVFRLPLATGSEQVGPLLSLRKADVVM